MMQVQRSLIAQQSRDIAYLSEQLSRLGKQPAPMLARAVTLTVDRASYGAALFTLNDADSRQRARHSASQELAGARLGDGGTLNPIRPLPSLLSPSESPSPALSRSRSPTWRERSFSLPEKRLCELLRPHPSTRADRRPKRTTASVNRPISPRVWVSCGTTEPHLPVS